MAKCVIDKAYYAALADNYDLVGTTMISSAKLSYVDKASSVLLNAVVSSNSRDEIKSDLNQIRKQTLSYFYIFCDDEIVDDAYSYLENVSYMEGTGLDYSMFLVSSNAILSKTGVYKVPIEMMIPDDIRHTSSVFMAHEVVHMMKERNPKECREFLQYGEVIPMLMELIIAYSYEYSDISNIFAQRSGMVKGAAQSFKELYAKYKHLSIEEDKRIYESALNESGVYVNSFYYTLALFSLYIANSRFVLRMIANVLKCRCATSDVIRYISEYDIKKLYETGLDEFNFSIK